MDEEFDNDTFRYSTGYTTFAPASFEYTIGHNTYNKNTLEELVYDPINMICLQDGEVYNNISTLVTTVITRSSDNFIVANINFQFFEEAAGIHQCIFIDAASNGSEILLPHPVRKRIG